MQLRASAEGSSGRVVTDTRPKTGSHLRPQLPFRTSLSLPLKESK